MPHSDPAVSAIEARNRRVEAEKAWEGSWTRRLSIAAITYVTASLFLWSSGSPTPLLSALFPPAGYLLSTLSLPWAKRRWIARHRAVE